LLAEQHPLSPQPTIYDPFVVLLPHGPGLASRAEGGRLGVWRFGGAAPAAVPVPDARRPQCWPLAAAPDGKTLATTDPSGSTVWLWRVDGAAVRETASFEAFAGFRPEDHGPRAAAFSPDGKSLAVGGAGKIALWDLGGASPKERAVVSGLKGYIASLAFGPDGRTLFSCAAEDGVVRVWSVGAGGLTEQDQVKPERPGWLPALTADGKTLALGTLGGVELWDLGQGKPRRRMALPQAGAVISLAFSPDGRALAADHALIVWDPASGRKLREWRLPGPVRWARFATDGRHLLTANGNGTVYVLRLAPPARTNKD
jgi:WD40 repeat protein